MFAALALAAAVLALHALGLERAAQWHARSLDRAVWPVQRVELAFVDEMKPAAPATTAAGPEAPPATVAAPPRSQVDAAPHVAAPRLKRLRPAEPAASVHGTESLVARLTVADDLPQVAPVVERGASGAPTWAALPTQPAFDWPPSTELRYRLTGHYRGEMHGSAQVRWIRLGMRYQVQMDVVVGLPILPLMSRVVTSEGELSDRLGLQPRRYDERTRIGLSAPNELRLAFDAGSVTLADGRRLSAPPTLQDAGSQFVQLAWLFNTQPHRLRAGEHVELPLALPRRVGRWVYEVQAEESLATPMGTLAVHALKPLPGSARPGELSVQMWIAPSLHHLPVRIRIEQAGDTHIDLLLETAPRLARVQAASAAASADPLYDQATGGR